MTPPTHAEVLSDATRELVNGTDVTDLLARLVRRCAAAMHADAVGLLVRAPQGGLELLASTSHRVSELEMYQVQQDSGPCIDALATGEPVSVVGEVAVRERWPSVGAAIVGCGYTSVHAFPLLWRGRVLGGLNVFSTVEEVWDEEMKAVGQTFADVSTLAVVHLPEVSDVELDGRIQRALAGRVVIEQAKGVLAHLTGAAADDAYDQLGRLAADRGTSLTATARAVIEDATRRARGSADSS